MKSQAIFGNAGSEGVPRRGWFIGHFLDLPDDPRSTSTLEVKWAIHQAGDGRNEWATNVEATTLSILIQGRFCIQFPEQKLVLASEGDYALWCPGVPHTWSAEETSTILTIRWPSKSGDSVGIKS